MAGYVLVQPVVRGIQSQGVIANVKHYVRAHSTTDTWHYLLFKKCRIALCRAATTPDTPVVGGHRWRVRAQTQLDNNQEGALWLGNVPNGTTTATAAVSQGPAQGAGDRHSTSAIVDEQTQMELYWPPFEGAVEAGVLSVMCANNLVRKTRFSSHILSQRVRFAKTGSGHAWETVGHTRRVFAGERCLRVREQPHRKHHPEVVGRLQGTNFTANY